MADENRLKPLDWLMLAGVFVLVLIALAQGAEAQIVRVTSESEPSQVCRIVDGQRECTTVRTTDYGTGVIVDRDASHDYVLTAAHVVDQTTHYVHGRRAELVATHDTEDLALLRMPRTTWDVAKLGGEPPIGLAVYLDGLGGSGKADAKDYRRARGQIISTDTVSHQSRDGDSGGGIAVGSTLYGIITATNGTSTKFVPVSICRTFCRQHGVCRPPASVRTAPVPGPPHDIPDRQKVQRIEQLEMALLKLQNRIDGLPDRSAEVSKKVDRLTVIVQELAEMKAKPGPAGPPGANGLPGRDGRDGPIEVRILSVDDAGKRRVVRHMSFKAGEPIDLLFHERLLTGEEK